MEPSSDQAPDETSRPVAAVSARATGAGGGHLAPSRAVAAILLLVSAALFVLAKNVTSANEVTFERVEYWLVGLLPALFWFRFPGRTLRPRLALSGALAWLLGLLVFLLAELTYAWEALPFGWRLYLRDSPALQDALQCAVSAVLGALAAFAAVAAAGRGRPQRLGDFLSGLLIVSLLNFSALFVFLFIV